MNSNELREINEDYKKNLPKSTLEIRILNDKFFAEGTIKYEKGLAKIEKDGKLSFTGRASGLKSFVSEKELVVGSKNKPFSKALLLKKTEGVECKRIINKPCKFLIASRDNMKLDTQNVDIGDIIMIEPYVRFYDNYMLFVSEVDDIKKADLQSAVMAFKNGERGEGVTTPRTRPWYSEDGVFIPNEALGMQTPVASRPTVNKPTTINTAPKRATNNKASVVEEDPFAKSWTKDADEERVYDTATYSITKKVNEYTQTGAVRHYGYELIDHNTGAVKQLPESEVCKLARDKQIRNAIFRNNALTGRGCSLANLEQAVKG